MTFRKDLAAQKAVVLDEIKQVSNSHVVRKGLSQFKGTDLVTGSRCPVATYISYTDIPGVMDAGYNPNITAAMAAKAKSQLGVSSAFPTCII